MLCRPSSAARTRITRSNRTLFVLDSTNKEHKMNDSGQPEGELMVEWLMDAAAGFGLVVFIGSVFLLARALRRR